MQRDFYNYSRSELAGLCLDGGHPAVHARDLYRHAYKALRPDPWATGQLPRELVRHMAAEFSTSLPLLRRVHQSAYDGSVKFLLGFNADQASGPSADGNGDIEAVLMPEKQRLTLCVSSQVGCAQACVFCHTGRMGLKRQLTAGEIVGQVVLAERWLSSHPEWLKAARLPAHQRLTNIVFMGMGEPLDNVEAVIKALEILIDPYGLALGLARISVSTAGHLPGIERLYSAFPKVRLALSVHSVDDGQRSRIMPINRRWPLKTVVERLGELSDAQHAPVMFQYTMINGVNDSLADAEGLADLAAGLKAKVNLIPLNEVSTSRLTAPSPQRLQAFRDLLHARDIRVMVRYSKGQDIAAACGQLVIQSQAAPL